MIARGNLGLSVCENRNVETPATAKELEVATPSIAGVGNRYFNPVSNETRQELEANGFVLEDRAIY